MPLEPLGKRIRVSKGAFKPARYRVSGRDNGVPFCIAVRTKRELKKLQTNQYITELEWFVLN